MLKTMSPCGQIIFILILCFYHIDILQTSDVTTEDLKVVETTVPATEKETIGATTENGLTTKTAVSTIESESSRATTENEATEPASVSSTEKETSDITTEDKVTETASASSTEKEPSGDTVETEFTETNSISTTEKHSSIVAPSLGDRGGFETATEKSNETTPPAKEIIGTFTFTHKDRAVAVKININRTQCKAEESTGVKLKEAEAPSKGLGVSAENPATSCVDIETTGKYYINPSNPFRVICDVDLQATCLTSNRKGLKTTENVFLKRPFWLSETGSDLIKLYGVTRAQISHLLSTSEKVTQVIRYYSIKNEAIPEKTSKTDPDKFLQGLLWNDHLVGIKPTDNMPLYYSTEECKGGVSGWKCTDIILETTSNNRLPVTDFFIRDIGADPSSQKFFMEHQELCFYYLSSEDF